MLRVLLPVKGSWPRLQTDLKVLGNQNMWSPATHHPPLHPRFMAKWVGYLIGHTWPQRQPSTWTATVSTPVAVGTDQNPVTPMYRMRTNFSENRPKMCYLALVRRGHRCLGINVSFLLSLI